LQLGAVVDVLLLVDPCWLLREVTGQLDHEVAAVREGSAGDRLRVGRPSREVELALGEQVAGTCLPRDRDAVQAIRSTRYNATVSLGADPMSTFNASSDARLRLSAPATPRWPRRLRQTRHQFWPQTTSKSCGSN